MNVYGEHHGARIGKSDKVLLWSRVIANYRCNACGDRLLWKVDYDQKPPRHFVRCSKCGAEDDVIHWRALEKQRLDAYEVIGALPDEMKKALGVERSTAYNFEPRDLTEARRILNEGGWKNAGDVNVQIVLAGKINTDRIVKEENGTRTPEETLAYGRRALRGEPIET